MKYLVEINSKSAKGSNLMKYIEELGASEKDVHFINEVPLTDEEMALPPTRRVSETTLTAWLKPDDNEESFNAEEAIAYIRKKRAKKRKPESNEP